MGATRDAKVGSKGEGGGQQQSVTQAGACCVQCSWLVHKAGGLWFPVIEPSLAGVAQRHMRPFSRSVQAGQLQVLRNRVWHSSNIRRVIQPCTGFHC